jgi:CubicO group peptidase (beta-lactamase class C family)
MDSIQAKHSLIKRQFIPQARTMNKYKLVILFTITLSFFNLFCSNHGSQTVTDSREQHFFFHTITDFQSELDSLMNEISVPGAAVAILSRDSIVWIGTFGFANMETGELVNENTHFCIGSCTKSFTGLGFLKLLNDGKIDLNTPVREIAPEIEIDNPWEDTHPVRIVHLLEHTAGFDDSHPNWFYFEGPVMSLQCALKTKARLRKVRWQPGTRFSYSSAGFTLAGYILGKVCGQRYEEYITKSFMKPIGMGTSTIGSSEECRKLLAIGYDRNSEPFPVWYDYDEPAGAMNSSIREMALFIQFMLNRGTVDQERIIRDDLFDKIGKPTTTLAARAGLESGYSFGIGTKYRGGAKWFGHSGAVPGFLSEYAYNLDEGLGFVVLQNSFDLSFDDDVFSHVWRYMTSLVDSVVPPPPASILGKNLEKYCGYYEPRSPRIQLAAPFQILSGGITILCQNDTLYSQGFMDTKQPLIPVSRNLFRRPTDPEASRVFFKIPNGRMAFASQGSYYERTSIWKTYVYRILVFGALIIMTSSVVYSLFWIPVHICKRLMRKDNISKYLRMRVVPLLAIISLIIGLTTIVIADQTVLELGQRTPANVLFFILTWLFAGLSVLSLYTSYRSFFRPVKKIARWYAVILSLTCFGMSLYLGFWDLIGLKLWIY